MMFGEPSTRNTLRQTVASLWSALVELLYERTILVLLILFCIAMLGSVWNLQRLYSDMVDSTALNEAARYSDALTEFRTLYTREVVEIVRTQNVIVTHDYDQGINKGKAIPLPATLSMLLGNRMAERELGGQTALYSGYPFPWREKEWQERDQFAKDAWQAVTKNPGEPFHRIEDRDGRRWLRFATADLMRKACVDCHNTHPDTPRHDWKEGDVRGVLEVSLPLDSAIVLTRSSLRGGFAMIAMVGVAGLSSLAIAIGRLRRIRSELAERIRERTATLRHVNEELESEISDRQCAEQELRIAVDKLSRSNCELEQFAYVASHDLQQPLRTVTGFCQLLKRRYHGRFDGDADEFLDHAVNGATRMQTLINDLLTYSRVGSRGKSFETTDCTTVVDQTLNDLEWAVEEAGAEVTRDELPTLSADTAQIGQLFQNLIDNGLKFHGEESPRIHVSAKQDGPQWIFSVRDNGIGIDPKYTERIFAVFQRLHGPDDYAGTGIGLAICKKIVERHDGRIWLESAPGQGATFYFTLPANGNDNHDDTDHLENDQEGARRTH